MDNHPIGIFDSGVGGLTVMREIEKVLPHEHLIYLGDTARVPYGNKSPQTVVRFSIENVLFLLEHKVKAVVIACNTSSSLALDYLQRTFSVPILGVIEPAVEKALSVSGRGAIGIIGTKSTICSRAYVRQLRSRKARVRCYQKACPLFVPLVEEGLLSGKLTEQAVEMYLREMKGKIDTLILGCTHYPLLKKIIASYLEGVYLVNSAREVAHTAKELLTRKGLLNGGQTRRREFFVSDEPGSFSHLAGMFLGKRIPKPKVIHV